MTKKVLSMLDRNTQPVITMVPLRVREIVERLAQKENVSMSEIGRRALTAYVELKAR